MGGQNTLKELLNPTGMPSNLEAESEDFGPETSISGVEDTEVVKKLLVAGPQGLMISSRV